MNNRNSPRSNHGPYMRHGGQGPAYPQHLFNNGHQQGMPNGFQFGGQPPMPPEQMAFNQPPDAAGNMPSMLPAVQPALTGEVIQPANGADSKSSGFSLPSLTEIKGMVDRLGGLDGIISGVTKVQKVVSSVSSMAPLLKVLFSSFSSKKSKGDSSDDDFTPRPRRKRRRKTGSTNQHTKRKRPSTLRKPKRR